MFPGVTQSPTYVHFAFGVSRQIFDRSCPAHDFDFTVSWRAASWRAAGFPLLPFSSPCLLLDTIRLDKPTTMMMLRPLSPLYVTLFTAAVVQAQQPTLSPTMSGSPAGTMDDATTPPPTMPPAANATTAIMDPTLTLEEIIMSNSDLTTLALAVNVSDILADLDPSAGYYTVFA